MSESFTFSENMFYLVSHPPTSSIMTAAALATELRVQSGNPSLVVQVARLIPTSPPTFECYPLNSTIMTDFGTTTGDPTLSCTTTSESLSFEERDGLLLRVQGGTGFVTWSGTDTGVGVYSLAGEVKNWVSIPYNSGPFTADELLHALARGAGTVTRYLPTSPPSVDFWTGGSGANFLLPVGEGVQVAPLVGGIRTLNRQPGPSIGLFEMSMVRVSEAGLGATYSFYIGKSEVTNSQYATFLNDAQLDGGATGRGSNMTFDADGVVRSSGGGLMFAPTEVAAGSLISYVGTRPPGTRYVPLAGFQEHPIVHVSWLGAIKFANWLTIDQGLNESHRCYTEGANLEEWHPRTISTIDWASRDLDSTERQALVAECFGFRLPMDNLGSQTGHVSNQANGHNEWYKAAAYDPLAPDSARPGPGGETVAADHWAYGFGRDLVVGADANYLSSGDPFSGTSPVGFFNGSSLLDDAATLTHATENLYGINDISGNVAEWLQDQGPAGQRAVRGAGFDSAPSLLAASYRDARPPTIGDPAVGFRVAQVLFEGDSSDQLIPQRLHEIFDEAGLEEIETGLLLELGSVLHTDLVRFHDGTATLADALSRDQFLNAYGDLSRGCIALFDPEPSECIPAASALEGAARIWLHDADVVPLALALVDYTAIDPAAFADGRLMYFEGGFVQNGTPSPPVWVARRFLGTTILASEVVGPTARFVLPSELLIARSAEPITSISVQFDGQAGVHSVVVDEVFEVQDLPIDENGELRFTVSINGGGAGKTATGKAEGKPGLPPCITLPPTDGSIPFNGQVGRVNVRVYPAPETIPDINPAAFDTCPATASTTAPWTGPLNLKKVMVVLDRFDPSNDRTQDDIWCEFGEFLETVRTPPFGLPGFDLVVLDYDNGRDYIQRNGYVVREVLKAIPGWLDPEDAVCDEAVMLGLNMGTQTGRWALGTAEAASEDHHVNDFIAIDGPFQGLNFPVSLHKAAVTFSDLGSQEAKSLVASLGSPAAKQMFGFYLASQSGSLFADYYSQAEALGLPADTRKNVAVALGSGGGDPWRLNLKPKGSVETFASLNSSSILSTYKYCAGVRLFGVCVPAEVEVVCKRHIVIDAKTDHVGRVFGADASLWCTSGVNVIGIFQGSGPSASLGVPFGSLTIPSGQATLVDLAPGTTLPAAGLLVDGFNASASALLGKMESSFRINDFVPTYSALDVDLGSLSSNLSAGGAVLDNNTSFDSVWYPAGDPAPDIPANADGLRLFLAAHLFEYLLDGDDDGKVTACDCDDDDPEQFPGNTETCDCRDNDCDGAVDNLGGSFLCTPCDFDSWNLFVTASGIEWNQLHNATSYDLVMGSLSSLRSTSGDFSVATTQCLADGATTTPVSFSGIPPAGEAFWFLARGVNAAGAGTYGSGEPSQQGNPDAGIALSPNACP